MKSFFAWLVVVGALVGGGFYGFTRWRAKHEEQAYKLALADIKRDFQARAVGLTLVDSADYPRQLGAYLRAYFAAVADLGSRYPALADPARERERGAKLLKEGKINHAQKQARDSRIDTTLELYKRMQSGQYVPLYSAVDKSFRFDIVDMTPVMSGGEPHVKLSFVHWGAWGPVRYGAIEGNIRAPQEKGKPTEALQIMAEGPPAMQVNPEQWVMEFVPGVQIGHYELPAMPRQATALDLRFKYGIGTAGGTQLQADLAFAGIPVPDSWKLQAGQIWQAEEREATPDELRAMGVNTN